MYCMRPSRLDPEVLLLEQNQFPAIYAEGTFTSPPRKTLESGVWDAKGGNELQTAQNALSSQVLWHSINSEFDELRKEKSALEKADIHIGEDGLVLLQKAEERVHAEEEKTKPLRDRLADAIQDTLAFVALAPQEVDFLEEALELALQGTGATEKDRISMRNLYVAIRHHKSFPAHTI